MQIKTPLLALCIFQLLLDTEADEEAAAVHNLSRDGVLDACWHVRLTSSETVFWRKFRQIAVQSNTILVE